MVNPESPSPRAPIRPVILSGGSGTRLWPLSTAARPKQFLPLIGERSLLHETFARVLDPAQFAPPTIVCGIAHVDQVRAAGAEAGLVGFRIVAEPVARNTAAAIALAALTAVDGDELTLILPSDHHIEQPKRFRRTVAEAVPAAERGMIVTFGMIPTRIETGFGYVEMGDAAIGAVHDVRRFVEKPDAEAAAKMIATGRFLWNGGIFFARASTLIDAFERHSPDVLQAVRESLTEGADGALITPDAAAFARAPAIAFDHAVMEKFDRIGVIPSDFGWSDVGSWTAIDERAAKDSYGNAVEAGSVVLDGTNNLVRSSGPKIVVLGMEATMVLATDEVVLVAPLAEAQRVREAFDWYQAQSVGT